MEFCETLAAREAVALFLDYGPLQSAPGSSVQAIRDGAYADPLHVPGQADLTAHVDFAAIAARVKHVQGPVKQNAFLTGLGLFQRSDFLASKFPEQAQNFDAGGAAPHRTGGDGQPVQSHGAMP